RAVGNGARLGDVQRRRLDGGLELDDRLIPLDQVCAVDRDRVDALRARGADWYRVGGEEEALVARGVGGAGLARAARRPIPRPPPARSVRAGLMSRLARARQHGPDPRRHSSTSRHGERLSSPAIFGPPTDRLEVRPRTADQAPEALSRSNTAVRRLYDGVAPP